MFRADHTNLLAALEWDADPQKRLRLVSALSFRWCVGGFLSEGRHRFEQTLAASSQPTSERAWALLAATWVAQNQGDLTVADRWLDEAERLGEAWTTRGSGYDIGVSRTGTVVVSWYVPGSMEIVYAPPSSGSASIAPCTVS
ncbi:hypothetical protein [Streptomyces mirabilis]|jgi:hypothetical protein|uniref:Uncharacterized protein n=1 Tax=Streptomyces mirabilis TaxID=68239 RepID=A0A1I2XCB2_9ACTN|nr:hypothetical protein [Streptomyces mirabilis]SFH11105.1 hypothetical protein SAMN02787118_14524 [Streptomyces mirabilis]